MPRLHLDLPRHLPFATTLTVRVTDLNYGGHLGNDRLLSLLHEARFRFLRHHGLSERDCGGSPLVMADARIAYRAEAFAGDELLVALGFAPPERVAVDLCYRVSRPRDGTLVAEARLGLVFLDPGSRRPCAVPEVVRALCPVA